MLFIFFYIVYHCRKLTCFYFNLINFCNILIEVCLNYEKLEMQYSQ